MPAWPTMYPALQDGKVNEKFDTRPRDMIWTDGTEKDRLADTNALTSR